MILIRNIVALGNAKNRKLGIGIDIDIFLWNNSEQKEKESLKALETSGEETSTKQQWTPALPLKLTHKKSMNK